ncbi:methyl-accepting chemotaxis protein [Natronocella acetinitrilica]|uniref:Methyl-accepting chemotaxis protein n=1 Tax=Natronocella acetinitrilica TaxID=414046 RepID=A0AAE3G6B8_9GAMM|nr:methyl-accepting chemotaxis protein [Natronocella acetinitrilica]MCP1676494.1 methyl-accepting chemotaxis protein [Natronocella acetinitrilica]
MFNRHLSVGQRLGLGFALVLSLLIMVTLVGVQRVGVIDSTLTEVDEGATLKQRYAINFRGSVHDRAIAIRDAVLEESNAGLQRHLNDIEVLKSFYAESAEPMNQLFDAQGASAQEQRLLGDIQAIEQTTLALSDRLIALRQTNDIGAARTFLLNEVSPAYTEWLNRINAFIDYQEASIATDIARVQRTASDFSMLMLVVAGIAVLLSIIVSLLIIRRLKSVLGGEPEEVAAVIRKISQGHLATAIHTDYPRSVMGELKGMSERLRETMTEVRSAADNLTGAAAGLLEASESNRNQIRQQSEGTTQMAVATNEMAASVAQVAGNANRAAEATQNADEGGMRVNAEVRQTAEAIEKLADTLEDAAGSVQQVYKESTEIETIVEVIQAIAEQTNLLALNAAIEAARAGTHGRGFAIVADEVRALASRTQDSTREISNMIDKLQEGTGKAVKVMENSRELAQTTVAQTARTEASIAGIREDISSINQMNTEIATAAEQQSRVADELNQNINRITEATEITGDVSDRVADASRDLSSLADQLTEKVAFFKS